MQCRPRYAWIDVPFFVLTIVLLIPLAFHLAEIVAAYIAALWNAA